MGFSAVYRTNKWSSSMQRRTQCDRANRLAADDRHYVALARTLVDSIVRRLWNDRVTELRPTDWNIWIWVWVYYAFNAWVIRRSVIKIVICTFWDHIARKCTLCSAICLISVLEHLLLALRWLLAHWLLALRPHLLLLHPILLHPYFVRPHRLSMMPHPYIRTAWNCK